LPEKKPPRRRERQAPTPIAREAKDILLKLLPLMAQSRPLPSVLVDAAELASVLARPYAMR
jgi:hypothetical protein